MRRQAFIGGLVLTVALVPAVASAAQPSAVTVTPPTVTYTQGQTPVLTPSYRPSVTPTVPAVCTATPAGGGTPFTPTRTTAPGVYTTQCSGASESGVTFTAAATPGTLTIRPSVTAKVIPALLVGGGKLPVEVTLASAGKITLTLPHGASKSILSASGRAGKNFLTLALVDSQGKRLRAGAYVASIAVTANGATTTKSLRIRIAAGTGAVEVALSPLPGGHLGATTPIVFRYSQPVAAASHPGMSPSVSGRWSEVGAYESVFTPTGFGFSPGAAETFTERTAVWEGTAQHTLRVSVRAASMLRAEQLLAQLAYLPLKFTTSARVARTAAGEAAAATDPPRGRFTWRYRDTPSALVQLWTGDRSVMVKGAVMAFESDHGLATDGTVGPQVWRALELAAISGRGNRFGYSFVHVYRTLPEHLVVWHDGVNAFTTLVNTGIPGRETNYGVFPIYLREAIGSMSGTNPNGTHYDDTGIRWISYFSGGDALHQFPRASYGFPQSLGCVEMTDAGAYGVWRLTEIGTLVDTLS